MYLDAPNGLVRFVQITFARSNSFDIGYFYEFLHSLQKSTASFSITKLDIFFVIESKFLLQFQFTWVTGQGLLTPFGWDYNDEIKLARRVGIKGVASCDDFNWDKGGSLIG